MSKCKYTKTKGDLIAYKSFGENYCLPETWQIKEDSIIKNELDKDRRNTCGYGINVATKKWCENNCRKQIWRVLIKKEDLKDAVVPYATSGKFRVGKVKLLKKL